MKGRSRQATTTAARDMSASESKPKLTKYYGLLAPLGVMIIHYGSFRPVLTCQKQTFAELEETANQFFVFPPNTRLKFFTTFVNDDMVRIDPEAWPRIYQTVNALWIEFDLWPPRETPAETAFVRRIIPLPANPNPVPTPGPTPPQSTATPTLGADTTSSDEKKNSATSSGSATPKSAAAASSGGDKSPDEKKNSAFNPGPTASKSTATPSSGDKSSDTKQPSASGSGAASSTRSTTTSKTGAASSGPSQTPASSSSEPTAAKPASTSTGGTTASADKSSFAFRKPFLMPKTGATSSSGSSFSFGSPSSGFGFGANSSAAPTLGAAKNIFSFGSSGTTTGSSSPSAPGPSPSSSNDTTNSQSTTTRFAKPVIYLYPPTLTSINVRLSLISPWEFSAIYPLATTKRLESGPLVGRESVAWDVLAFPDGQLRLSDGLQVSYLYWEAETRTPIGVDTPPSSRPLTPDSMLHVERFDPSKPNLTPQNSVLLRVTGDVTKYLDKALLALGLHTEARTSFITYWLPSFVKHEYIALRFVEQSSYEAAARLDIIPKPDVVKRVFMLFRGVDGGSAADWSAAEERANRMNVAEWKMIVGVEDEKMRSKNLFRVLEWGGMEVRS